MINTSRSAPLVLLLTLGLVPTVHAGDMLKSFASGLRSMGLSTPETSAEAPPEPIAARRYPLAKPPACKSVLNMDVQFTPVPKEQLDARGFILAAALPSPWMPVVVYDRESFSLIPPEFQLQILLHECAHKSLGLMSSPEEEDAADCEAAKRLQVEYSYGRKEFDLIGLHSRQILEKEGVSEELIRRKLKAVAACFRPTDL